MKPPVVLVFGEGDHDRKVLVLLTRALVPTAPRAEARRSPLVLVKGRESAKARKNAFEIAQVVRLESKIREVPFVIAHQDCDAVEPAHVAASDGIERALTQAGVRAVVAATPAWEMEAWLFLWPDACVAVCRGWRRPSRDGANVGLIAHAKKALKRDLRPPDLKVRDYEEADSIRIVEKAIEMDGTLASTQRCASFERFRARLTEVAAKR